MQHTYNMRFSKRTLKVRLTHGKDVNRVTHVKASAHSFKQFTSRLLKSTFSLSMHIYNSDGRHA